MVLWKSGPVALIVWLTFGLAWADLPQFEELDLDGNGYIDEDEASALTCLAEHFDSIETESPKGLDRREFEAAVGQFCQRP